MTNEIIELPEVEDIKEMLDTAEKDVREFTQEEGNEEFAEQSQLILETIAIVKELIGTNKDLNKLDRKEKISIAAHLTFTQGLLEDFFFGADFDDEDLEGFEDEEEEE